MSVRYMKRTNVCGKTATVVQALQQALASRLNSDFFDYWAVKDMIKMFFELCMAQLFIRVAMKAGPVSCVPQAGV